MNEVARGGPGTKSWRREELDARKPPIKVSSEDEIDASITPVKDWIDSRAAPVKDWRRASGGLSGKDWRREEVEARGAPVKDWRRASGGLSGKDWRREEDVEARGAPVKDW